MNCNFLLALVAMAAVVWLQPVRSAELTAAASAPARCARRADEKHNIMLHNHLSRKVFDRACAASKDTIDEIVICLTGNASLMKAIKVDTAQLCYKEAFNQEFDPKDVIKHKELICNNRDKFESMTTCIYKKTGEVLDSKEMEKLTEILVDVGLCIINALDG